MADEEEERRPQLRWLGDMEQDLKEIGMRRWRSKAVDRNEWQRILEEA
jgi:hypothetical protein